MQLTVPSPVTAVNAKALCTARDQCWMTVAAAGSVLHPWGRHAIGLFQGWMVLNVVQDSSASSIQKRMTLVMSLESAKSALMGLMEWIAEKHATACLEYVMALLESV